jgi:hypothetical protein
MDRIALDRFFRPLVRRVALLRNVCCACLLAPLFRLLLRKK